MSTEKIDFERLLLILVKLFASDTNYALKRMVGKRADSEWIKSKIMAPAYPPYLARKFQ